MAILLPALDIIPHHHHGLEAGTVTEYCTDDAPDDAGENLQHDPSCIACTEYYVLCNDDSRIKGNALCGDNCPPVPFLPVLYAVADLLLYPAETATAKPEYGEPVLAYTSADTGPYRGLRAPPAFLS